MTTATIESSIRADPDLREPFRRYEIDWSQTAGRTDTPDMLGLFAEASENDALLAEAYEAMADEHEAAYEDLAAASFETLPAD